MVEAPDRTSVGAAGPHLRQLRPARTFAHVPRRIPPPTEPAMPLTLSLRSAVIACSVSFLLGAGAVVAQQRAPQTRREPQFENEHLKVWKSIILPNQPLTQHRHDHGRALVALTDGVLDVVDPAGRVTTTYRWEKGKAYWLDADPPGETHADVNNTTQPIEVIVVELKNDR
jgi:hypothetical protein